MNHRSITNHTEQALPEGTVLVSKTDTLGHITYCNQDFINCSGYSETELLGSNHNIVRHPDTPSELFEQLWRTITQGKSWSGTVKARNKDGSFTWVNSNITPVIKNRKTVEYLSVRVAPTRNQIDETEQLYERIRNGQAQIEPRGLGKLINNFEHIKTTHMLYGTVVGAVAMQTLVSVALIIGIENNWILAMLSMGSVSTIIFGVLITKRIEAPLEQGHKPTRAFISRDLL